MWVSIWKNRNLQKIDFYVSNKFFIVDGHLKFIFVSWTTWLNTEKLIKAFKKIVCLYKK